MFGKSIQRLTDTWDIEFVSTNGMQNAISKYEIQNIHAIKSLASTMKKSMYESNIKL